jgi:hypothetical protein
MLILPTATANHFCAHLHLRDVDLELVDGVSIDRPSCAKACGASLFQGHDGSSTNPTISHFGGRR